MGQNVLYEDFKHQRRLTQRQFAYYESLREKKKEKFISLQTVDLKKNEVLTEQESNFVNYYFSIFSLGRAIVGGVILSSLMFSRYYTYGVSKETKQDTTFDTNYNKNNSSLQIPKKLYSIVAANEPNFFHPEKNPNFKKKTLELLISNDKKR